MPIYEYRCETCGETFEVFVRSPSWQANPTLSTNSCIQHLSPLHQESSPEAILKGSIEMIWNNTSNIISQ